MHAGCMCFLLSLGCQWLVALPLKQNAATLVGMPFCELAMCLGLGDQTVSVLEIGHPCVMAYSGTVVKLG